MSHKRQRDGYAGLIDNERASKKPRTTAVNLDFAILPFDMILKISQYLSLNGLSR